MVVVAIAVEVAVVVLARSTCFAQCQPSSCPSRFSSIVVLPSICPNTVRASTALDVGGKVRVGRKVAGDGGAFPCLVATCSRVRHAALVGTGGDNVLAGLGVVGVVQHLGESNLAEGRVLVAVCEVDALAAALVDCAGAHAEGGERERGQGRELHLEIGNSC